jgi:hypothetical protein
MARRADELRGLSQEAWLKDQAGFTNCLATMMLTTAAMAKPASEAIGISFIPASYRAGTLVTTSTPAPAKTTLVMMNMMTASFQTDMTISFAGKLSWKIDTFNIPYLTLP